LLDALEEAHSVQCRPVQPLYDPAVATAELRDWVSSARRGNPWRYRPARGEVEIAPLVSPLRLDVTLRQDFFSLYAEQRELYRTDFGSFAARARQHDYFVWFERIMCPSWQPHVLADPASFDAAWAARLRASAALYESFERRGFDERSPITLYEARRVLPTSAGKRVGRTIYAGDGNHRLALLMTAGQTTLLPSQYRVKRFRTLVPGDTTGRLVEALAIDLQRYVAFLATGYPSLRIEVAGGRIEVGGSADRTLLEEVRSVVRIDMPDLEGEPT
jgi:hypothetical protein